MAEHIKTSAIKRAGPSIVGIDIDGDREAWKIHIVRAARVNDVSERFVCVVHDKLSDLYYELLQPASPPPPQKMYLHKHMQFLNNSVPKPVAEMESEGFR